MTASDSSIDRDAFVASMPRSYGQKYNSQAVAAHFAIAVARADRPVKVGLISDAENIPALCVVAEDQPGLLATISGAMIHCGLDVVDAEAYTRKLTGGQFEAVDLFWARRQGGPNGEPVAEADAIKLETFLVGVLRGEQRFPTVMPPGGSIAPPVHATDTRVRFLEDSDGGLGTLEVETGDRSGLLWALSRALFEHKVQIITSQVRTRNGRVFDRFVVVEVDGSPINEARRLEIQVAVMGAIEPARRRISQHPSAELPT